MGDTRFLLFLQQKGIEFSVDRIDTHPLGQFQLGLGDIIELRVEADNGSGQITLSKDQPLAHRLISSKESFAHPRDLHLDLNHSGVRLGKIDQHALLLCIKIGQFSCRFADRRHILDGRNGEWSATTDRFLQDNNSGLDALPLELHIGLTLFKSHQLLHQRVAFRAQSDQAGLHLVFLKLLFGLVEDVLETV